VAALWALACVPSILSNPPLFLVFLMMALCGVVAVSWWPAPDAVEEVHP
jgi:hypothetical protein